MYKIHPTALCLHRLYSQVRLKSGRLQLLDRQTCQCGERMFTELRDQTDWLLSADLTVSAAEKHQRCFSSLLTIAARVSAWEMSDTG